MPKILAANTEVDRVAMANLPSGDGTSETPQMTDLAVDLADQLINAFQQVADGAGDGEGEVALDDGTLPFDNGAGDLEVEAKDGNNEWQELVEDEEGEPPSDGYDNEVKGEGVGEENPSSWVSPLHNHDYSTDETEAAEAYHNIRETVDVEFEVAKVLNFDDSDGDDLPAVMDQRFIPRGVFVQSDFLVDRPELHGSEEVDIFSASSSSQANAMMQGADHSQNVRIIEGHDDLELDSGAGGGGGYMSLTTRNRFLQTQVIQLPSLTTEDHNMSANLYDSLEREEEEGEEEELYPEDERDQEEDEFDRGSSSGGGRDVASGGGEDGYHQPREVHPLKPDRHHEEDEEDASAGFSPEVQQHHPWATERGDHGSGRSAYEDAAANPGHHSPARSSQRSASPLSPQNRCRDQETLAAQPPLTRVDSPKDSNQNHPVANSYEEALSNNNRGAIGLVVNLPKVSGIVGAVGGSNLIAGSESNDSEQSRTTETHYEPLASSQTKQPANCGKPQQLRGGPAGRNGGEGTRTTGSNPNQRSAASSNPAADQRPTTARSRGRAGVAGSVRQVAGGAQSQRPAVQGAAVAGIGSGGDGDGAVAGGNNIGGFAGPGVGHAGGAVVVGVASGSMLSSRTSSQGSIHSNTSNNSNSRVSGVGKESNSNRGSQPPRGVGRSFPGGGRPGSGSQYSAAGARTTAPPAQLPPQQQQLPRQQQQQQQAPPTSGSLQQLQASRNSRQPPPMASAKQGGAGGGARSKGDNRLLQLQQQQNQLMQEQQQLQLKKRQLQQQQHQQQQGAAGLPAGGMESPDGDHLVHHQPEAVVTQMGHMQQESHRQGGISSTNEVQGMEEVRSVLQGMLRLPKELASFDQRGFDFADSASDLLMDRPTYHLDGDNNSLSGLRTHGQEEMPDMFENFPSFSYKMFSEMSGVSSISDRSMNSELAYLRESLEKERYRRKHCEQQIQSLNGKLLEVQQQLAVAISTDKRKDIMIDQLDKQLAKVVEGWKKRETEKDEYMVMVMKEKAQIEETLHKQQTMIDSFEGELANTVEELKHEKESSSNLVDKIKAELSTAVHNQRHAEELLEAEQERVTLMERDWEQLKESRDLAERRAQQAQDRLHQEQDNWYQREQDLLSKIDQVKEANLKVMQMERVKLEQQIKKLEEMEEKLHTSETAAKRLEMEVDSVVREKESLKVEMSLTEAKYESAQRSLEADLHSQMEKKLADEVGAVQDRLRQEQEDQEEKHRHMVAELHQRHQRDMEMQMAGLRQDLSRKENDLKQQLAEAEASLSEYRQENITLKQAKQKLESQRVEVLSKLQFMMQSQWNEAVSLLVSTPQRKSLSASLSSSLASGGGALASSSYPHFNMASTAPPPAQAPSARVSSPRTTSHQEHRASQSNEPPPLNNLSGSPSSAHSSPRASPGPRSAPPVIKTAGTTLTASSSASSKSPLFTSGSGISLQDLSTLLSEGRYLPPHLSASAMAPSNTTANVHGVMHNGGVVLQQGQLRAVEEEEGSHSDHPPQHHQHHQHQQHAALHHHSREVGVRPQGQAVLMRPPQQSSSASQRSGGGGSLMVSREEDFSFISTSDLSRTDLSLLSSSQQLTHHQGPSLWSQQYSRVPPEEDGSRGKGENSQPDRRRERGGAGAGREERVGAMHLFQPESDRVLELSDLDLGSRTSILAEDASSADLLMMNGGGGLADGAEAMLAQHSLPTYSPSLSPPVKQGRGGEQDSADGDTDRENDRLNSSYREISRQLEEHQSRQRELQHYIRVLLEKPPQNVIEQPERDSIGDPDAMEISFTSVDLGLTDAAQADQMSTELQRLQQLRERQKASDQLSHSVPPRRGGGASKKPAPTDSRAPPRLHHSQSQSHQGTAAAGIGGVSPQQLAEISRLLGQYSEDVEASSAADRLSALQADPASMAQILNFLAALPHQQLGEGSVKSSSAKNSPRQQQQGRHTREPHRSKQQPDARHHSAGPDTSTCSLGSIDKHEKVMASSTRSSTSTSRKMEKKATNSTSASAMSASTSAKHSTRPSSKDQHHHPPVWK